MTLAGGSILTLHRTEHFGYSVRVISGFGTIRCDSGYTRRQAFQLTRRIREDSAKYVEKWIREYGRW